MSVFFFFSSRRRHTRLVSDWSSDVCSSDLIQNFLERLTSIGRAKNSSLGVRAVRMPQGRNKKAVRILRIDKNRGDLPCIAQPKVRPSFSRVSGLDRKSVV